MRIARAWSKRRIAAAARSLGRASTPGAPSPRWSAGARAERRGRLELQLPDPLDVGRRGDVVAERRLVLADEVLDALEAAGSSRACGGSRCSAPPPRSSSETLSVMTSAFWPSEVFTVKRSDWAAWMAMMRCWRISSMRWSSERRRELLGGGLDEDDAPAPSPSSSSAKSSSRASEDLPLHRARVALPPTRSGSRTRFRSIPASRAMSRTGSVVRRGRLDEPERAELLRAPRALGVVRRDRAAPLAERLEREVLLERRDAEAVRGDRRRRGEDRAARGRRAGFSLRTRS